MPQPTSEAPEERDAGKSRLDREIDEILSRNDNIRRLPSPPKPPRRNPVRLPEPRALSAAVPARVRRLAAAPIILALGLAFVAYLVADLSPFLANLLCLVAVVCIILPMAQRFRRPSSPPETRMWRGRVIDSRPASDTQSPLDGMRDWWKSRRG